MYSSGALFMHLREGHYDVYARHNESIHADKDNDLHTSTPYLTHSVYSLLMSSQSIAGDATVSRGDHVNNDI